MSNTLQSHKKNWPQTACPASGLGGGRSYTETKGLILGKAAKIGLKYAELVYLMHSASTLPIFY